MRLSWLLPAVTFAAASVLPLALFESWQGYLLSAPVAPRTSSASEEAWSESIKFAVDYYPSQWPEHIWESDAVRMAAANISHVRISEFDWAMLEPTDGNFNWTLLDRSIDVLSSHGLKVIIGTPTAAAPLWACRDYDILAVDDKLYNRRFGSRRHYSFSSPDFRMLTKRLVGKMASRYGSHPAVAAWQLDNEFGNSNSARSYDKHAESSFRQWLQVKYGSIEEMNKKQGRVFWSSQFPSFDDVVIPDLEVEESSPALRLDYYHFSSDELINYAKLQVDLIRKHSNKPITTNFMAFEFSYDHYEFARQTKIDFTTWDTYPLGNTEMLAWVSNEDKLRYARTGRPDMQALQHAFMRGLAGSANGQTRGAWGVMEQQPGPVNWAMYNPSPALGQVRLWLHDMISQGSSLNNIFRWRQIPFGQEQMHAGMLRIDNHFDVAYHEQQEAVRDVEALTKANVSTDVGKKQPKIAMVIDYPSSWYLQAQPQSGRFVNPAFQDYTFQYAEMMSTWHSALRKLAIDVDLIAPFVDPSNYTLLLVPTMVHIGPEFEAILAKYKGEVIFGPRTGSKVETLSQPSQLAPATSAFRERLPMKVTRVESLRSGLRDRVRYQNKTYNVSVWSEWLECERDGVKTSEQPRAVFDSYRDGQPAQCEHVDQSGRRTTYLGWYATEDFLMDLFTVTTRRLGIKTILGTDADTKNSLGDHTRLAVRGDALFAFNYNDVDEGRVEQLAQNNIELIVGGVDGDARRIGPSGVNIYRLSE